VIASRRLKDAFLVLVRAGKKMEGPGPTGKLGEEASFFSFISLPLYASPNRRESGISMNRMSVYEK
jgi:hypothetical protein